MISGNRNIVDIDSLDKFGIDFFGEFGQFAYQAKRSQKALYSKGRTWAEVELYLKNSIASAKANGLTDYRLCFPQDAKLYFTKGAVDTLKKIRFSKNGPSLWDTIEEIPGIISDPASLPKSLQVD